MKYDFQKIEKKWQEAWRKEGVYEPDLKEAKNSFYNLMMFPYPSAEGLHVGNMYAFVGSDIYGRFKRMQGNDVFEPIGLDGFGIHSENYAMKAGTHPMDQAKMSAERFYRQLEQIGNGFAWDEKLETYDPEYYRWTQWLFVQMFKHGLAYRKKQEVNWCPSDKTVLADEQVIQKQMANGKGHMASVGVCERCGTEVIKKELEQWFFKITNYAERLLGNLEQLDWSEKIKVAQRNWIGKSEGAIIKFKVESLKLKVGEVEVFTTRPDTLFGATYLVVAPEHEIISKIKNQISNLKDVEAYIKKAKAKSQEERALGDKEKTGVELKGVKAINPANGEEIPIWVADYVLASYGTGAIMAVPAHDERDFEFAKKYNLSNAFVIEPKEDWFKKWIEVMTKEMKEEYSPTLEFVRKRYLTSNGSDFPEAYTGDGKLINSGKFTGIESEKAKWEITKFVGGERKTQYRLRDWLISRQRYWGPPIPIMYCRTCWENLKHKTENLKLRKGIDYTVFDGKEYIIHTVPEKDLPVELPYIKDFRPTGRDESPLAEHKEFYEVKCPTCGGKARRETDVSDTFLDSAWYYLGYITLGNQKSKIKNQKFILEPEVIKKWLPVSMYIGGAEHAVLHLLYVRFVAMALYDWEEIGFEEPMKKFRAHGLLIKDGAKMSKSKGNVINPDAYIENFGADALRMYLMFIAPFEQGGDFRDQGILGVTRFLERAWKLQDSALDKKRKTSIDQKIKRLLHQTIKKVGEDIEHLRYNTAISALMILLNEFEKTDNLETSNLETSNLETFIKLLAPFAPHIAEEIWRNVLGNKISIHLTQWPTYEEKFIHEEKFTLVIQVNGKLRDSIEVEMGLSEKEASERALAQKRIIDIVGSAKPKRIIFVPNKLINIVL